MYLTEICDVFSGFAFKSFNNDKQGTPVIKIGNINADGTMNIEECSHTTESVNAKFVSKSGDIYIALSGATTGKVALMNVDGYYINQRVGIVRLRNDNIPISYLYYYLLSKTRKILDDAAGAAQPNISPKQIANYVFINRSTFEMENISNELNTLNNAIKTKKTQLLALDELMKSRFIEMFGTLENSIFPTYMIDDLCEFVRDGTHQTPTYTNDTINGYKFLSSKDVTTGKIDWSNIKYIPADLHEKLYKVISPKKGDILLAKNGTTGTAALVDTDEVFDIYVSLALLRFKKGNNELYLLNAINSDDSKKQFNDSLVGVGVPNLHLGKIKKVKLIIPPIELQNEFAEFVKLIDKSKFIVQQQIKDLEELLDSKMDEYFR